MKTTIYDLNNCELSDRNGSYGGNAGLKEGVFINNEHWLIKYPKSTAGMSGKAGLDSYMTSPLSEYTGSHIYKILGFDVHDTILGVRNNKLVVACKDFCDDNAVLREIRVLKNTYNKELEEHIETSFSSTDDLHAIDIDKLLIHFDYNPLLKNVDGLKERFWDCVIVDGFINNNDRNNGNWGLIFDHGRYRLAPVFDNGASFYNKASEHKIENLLAAPEKLEGSSLNGATAFSRGDKRLVFRDIINLDNDDLKVSILRIKPLIEERLGEVFSLIDGIPEQAGGIVVCSEARKTYYKAGLKLRYERMIEPRYREVLKQIEINEAQSVSKGDRMVEPPRERKKEPLFGPGGRVERARAKADELNSSAREQKYTDRDEPML